MQAFALLAFAGVEDVGTGNWWVSGFCCVQGQNLFTFASSGDELEFTIRNLKQFA